jgi:hypothetical protein
MATQVTVNGTIAKADGSAASGTITFKPRQPFYEAGAFVVGTAPTVATLSSGSFSVVLYATADLDASYRYLVTENITGIAKLSFSMALPVATPVRYESLRI